MKLLAAVAVSVVSALGLVACGDAGSDESVLERFDRELHRNLESGTPNLEAIGCQNHGEGRYLCASRVTERIPRVSDISDKQLKCLVHRAARGATGNPDPHCEGPRRPIRDLIGHNGYDVVHGIWFFAAHEDGDRFVIRSTGKPIPFPVPAELLSALPPGYRRLIRSP